MSFLPQLRKCVGVPLVCSGLTSLPSLQYLPRRRLLACSDPLLRWSTAAVLGSSPRCTARRDYATRPTKPRSSSPSSGKKAHAARSTSSKAKAKTTHAHAHARGATDSKKARRASPDTAPRGSHSTTPQSAPPRHSKGEAEVSTAPENQRRIVLSGKKKRFSAVLPGATPALLPDGTLVGVRKQARYVAADIDALIGPSLLGDTERQMKVPDVHLMNLHELEHISEDLVNSMQARKTMFRFASSEHNLIYKHQFGAFRRVVHNRVIGASLYIRIVDPLNPSTLVATRKETVRADAGDDHPDDTAAPQARGALKHVRDDIERILRRYVCRLLEPLPNELVIDGTHYLTCLPLLNLARRNVHQAIKDLDDFKNRRPVNPDGVPGGPPPAEEMEPMSPDVLAAEIAQLIRREVLLPLLHGEGSGATTVESASAEHSHHQQPREAKVTRTALRVCIGVGSSPVLAKIACDAEVVSVARKLEKTGSPSADKRAADVPLVSVRSIYRHTRTEASACEFMASFPMAHVPTVTRAFAEMLRTVFDIRTAGDILTQTELLFFCLPSASFRMAYAIAMGKAQFAEEQLNPLVCPDNLLRTAAPLRRLASNSISLVNASRTAFVNVFERLKGGLLAHASQTTVKNAIGYGRVSTDEEIRARILGAATETYGQLHARGMSFGSICVTMSENFAQKHMFNIKFEPQMTLPEVLERLKEGLEPVFRLRRRGGLDPTGGFYKIVLRYQHLCYTPLVPPAMLRDTEELTNIMIEVRRHLTVRSWVKKKRDEAWTVKPRATPVTHKHAEPHTHKRSGKTAVAEADVSGVELV